MMHILRTTTAATALAFLTACQMDTGTQPMDFEAMQAERMANTLATVETCRASSCARLNLDSGVLDDYGVLADLSHVNALMMSYTEFDDLSAIAPMTQLLELHIGSTRLTDLSGLARFSNLRLLHAQDLRVSDYSAIARLGRLEELVVGGSNLTDIGFVSGLSRLKTLDISNSGVTDLSPIAGLRRLENLEMMDMELPADLTPLLGLSGLRTVSTSQWSDLTPEQQAVVDRLLARGVNVVRQEVVVVC